MRTPFAAHHVISQGEGSSGANRLGLTCLAGIENAERDAQATNLNDVVLTTGIRQPATVFAASCHSVTWITQAKTYETLLRWYP